MAITPEHIAVALGRTAPESATSKYEQWSMWISDALMLIGARLGDLNEIDQGKLDYVVREAVVAQIRRPDDATQVAVSVDDGNVSRTYSSSAGRVTIRDEWWALLSGNSTRGTAFSITPGGSGCSQHLPWCSLNFLAGYCSCGADIAGYPIYENLP